MADIAIIGAGLVGLMAAERLRVQGYQVTVFDDPDTPAASEAAGGMLGTDAEGFDEDRWRTSNADREAAFALWRKWLSQRGLEPRATSTLFLAPDVAALGLCTEPLDAERLHPALAHLAADGALLMRDWAVDPRFLCDLLRRELGRKGVRFVDEAVREANWSTDRVTCETATGSHGADVLILSAGHRAGRIGLPVEVPALVPVAGQMVEMTWPHAQPLRTVLRDGVRYLIPRSDTTVVIGATVRVGDGDPKLVAADTDALIDWARLRVPVLDGANILDQWAGVRPRPALSHGPMVQTLNGRVVWANGHYRNGILLAPLTAERLLAQITALTEV